MKLALLRELFSIEKSESACAASELCKSDLERRVLLKAQGVEAEEREGEPGMEPAPCTDISDRPGEGTLGVDCTRIESPASSALACPLESPRLYRPAWSLVRTSGPG